jgi:hypothetical protein
MWRSIVQKMRTNVSEESDGSNFKDLYPEDGDSRFLRNVGTYLPKYMASYPRGL